MIQIQAAKAEFVREPLKGAFGFKGNAVNELWQVAVQLKSEKQQATGLATQSVLWSDAAVFAKQGSSGGNALMFLMTNYAVGLLPGFCFEQPEQVFDYLLPKVLEFGKKISENPKLRTTFALNSLVAVDFAVWSLFAKENKIFSFDGLIPSDTRFAMREHHEKLTQISLIPYHMEICEVKRIAREESRFLKIKIGNDPTGREDIQSMLEWDEMRLRQIHEAVKDIDNPDSESGKIVYYLDANGRYPDKTTLRKLLDFAEQIKAQDRILLLEEPFDEQNHTDVHDLPVRIAADESVHDVQHAIDRIEQGYGAIALKPIAKTLTGSFRILKEAYKRQVPCFCADLTVNPILVEWNKNFAARIAPLPQMKLGAFETNGCQNYRNWDRMESNLSPEIRAAASAKQGVYQTDYLFDTAAAKLIENQMYADEILQGTASFV